MKLPENPRILVVDDDMFAHSGVLLGLRLSSIITENLTQVYDGSEALELLQEGSQFDLIISDMDMPDVNGLDFYIGLRQMGDMTPFIMSTGGNADRQAEIEQVFEQHGGNAIFTEKPPTKEKLLDAIGKLSHPDNLPQPNTAGTIVTQPAPMAE